MNRRMQWILSAFGVPVVIVAAYGVARVGRAPAQQVAAKPGTVAEYPSMTALRKVEPPQGYELSWTITTSPLIVIAPHGGAIEERTSEIASEIAGTDHTQCHFKGRLPADNRRLHVTSERWDVEECLILIAQRRHALSIHGTGLSGRAVHIGGLDTETGARLATALRGKGFSVIQPASGGIAGTSPQNFVNRDADRSGVQLELTKDLRTALFGEHGATLSDEGRRFVDTVRRVYA